jgi:hypothetical protein
MITITYTWTMVFAVTRQADKRERQRAPDVTERDYPPARGIDFGVWMMHMESS